MTHQTSGSPVSIKSPTARKSSTAATASASSSTPTEAIVPLDSPLRTTPLHATIPAIKLPADFHTTNINPLTLQPFTDAELKQFGFEKTRNELATKEEIEKAREDALKALREKLDDRDAKIKELDREIDEKDKIREVERKVYRKKMGAGKEG